MLRALFVHDHRFSCFREKVYSTVFPYPVWQRYLCHFPSLTVVGRRSEVTGGGELSESSGPGVDFVLGEGLSKFGSLLNRRSSEHRLIARLVAEHDVVIARLPSENGLVAIAEARRAGRACLVEVVGSARDALRNHGRFSARMYAPIAEARMRRAVRDAEHVSYVTQQYLQARYVARAGAVVAVISNVEIAAIDAAVIARRERSAREVRETVVLGIIGSMNTEYKGVGTAIGAVRYARDRGRSVQLRVLGGGDPSRYVAEARRLGVESRVQFIGRVPAGQPVFDWLDGLDVYLQPSLAEGLPRALIEAMSRGLPAIGSNVGGIPELLCADCMFPPGDASKLADLIVRKAFDPGWRVSQSSRNAAAAAHYTKAVLDQRRSVLLASLSESARRNTC